MHLPLIEQPTDLDEVRSSYDRVADNYVAMNVGDIETHPWLRAAIDGFADTVRDRGPVLDVGCGPGRVTGYLAKVGLDVRGVDLSPRMIEHARCLHPGLRFDVASATDLGLADGSLGGILGWWSLFNLPRAVLPAVLARFARALVPGGHTIIATHVGEEDVLRTEAYGGVPVRWTTHRWRPERLSSLMTQAGFEPVAELRLAPSENAGPAVVLVGRRA
ncbi:MAG TPA: class I SAM-dependent methyltransferase [Jatrophihabitantaceae bacterium]